MKKLTTISEEMEKKIDGTFDLENKRIYFWKGIFSQWHRNPIYDPVHDVHANCSEQLMMANKAWLFGDKEAAAEILATDSPRKQKEIGRRVQGYVDEVWAEKRLAIVSDISYLKFSQDKELKEILLATEDFELVEASPEDPIWGIGMAQNDPDVLDKTKWKGQNLLGQAIMAARERLKAEQ